MKHLCLPGLAMATLFLASCGGDATRNDVAVSGRLTENGNPIKPPDGLPPGVRGLQLCFYELKDGKAGEPYFATLAEDGNFTVPGPKGKGIPPGKYLVSVEVAKSGTPPKGGPSGPPSSGSNSGLGDKYNGAYAKDKSKLQVEITGPSTVQVDVGNAPKAVVQ